MNAVYISAEGELSHPLRSTTRWVYVDGMDCTGKSSAAARAVAETGCEHRCKTMLGRNRDLDEAVRGRQAGLSFHDRAERFTEAAEVEASQWAWPVTDCLQESLVVMKSLAMVSSRLGSASRLASRLERALDAHPDFDSVVLLSVSAQERRCRLLERLRTSPRSVTPNDLLILNDPDGFARTEAALLDAAFKRYPWAVQIDTSERTKAEVGDLLVEAVRG